MTKELTANSVAVEDLVNWLAHEMPEPEELPLEQFKKVATDYVKDEMKAKIKQKVMIARIDYAAEREKFISWAGRDKKRPTWHTRRAYTLSMEYLEAWAARRGIPVPCMGPADADDYCADISLGVSHSTARRHIAVASAFFTHLARRHEHIRNPFRGTKQRPKEKALKDLQIPTAADVAQLVEASSGPLRAAIIIMAQRGLRVGGLPGLSIRDGVFTTTTKGSEHKGKMPPECVEALKAAGLSLRAPFEALSAGAIADRFYRLALQLVEENKIKARYSVHDLRHFFAVNEYQKNKDIIRLRDLLNHSSVTTTERYLRSLKLTEDIV